MSYSTYFYFGIGISEWITSSRDEISELKTIVASQSDLITNQAKLITNQAKVIDKLSSELLVCCFEISKFHRKMFKVNNKRKF